MIVGCCGNHSKKMLREIGYPCIPLGYEIQIAIDPCNILVNIPWERSESEGLGVYEEPNFRVILGDTILDRTLETILKNY